MLQGTNTAGARFGMSIVSPGDIDQNGYDDVLIGAPAEDNVRGAVYVYFVTSMGIRESYYQVKL